MKILTAVAAGLLLAGCNQVAQQEANMSPAAGASVQPVSAGPAGRAAVVAQDDMQALEPIYMPLVDMHRKTPARFARDHAECRALAAPQERAARDAMSQQQAGAALQVAGVAASFLPVGNFRQAVNLSNATGMVQDIGAATQANAAGRGMNATEDYALVVNNCLSRRNYTLLRA
jgi:hypothetical protein